MAESKDPGRNLNPYPISILYKSPSTFLCTAIFNMSWLMSKPINMWLFSLIIDPESPDPQPISKINYISSFGIFNNSRQRSFCLKWLIFYELKFNDCMNCYWNTCQLWLNFDYSRRRCVFWSLIYIVELIEFFF